MAHASSGLVPAETLKEAFMQRPEYQAVVDWCSAPVIMTGVEGDQVGMVDLECGEWMSHHIKAVSDLMEYIEADLTNPIYVMGRLILDKYPDDF